MTTFPNGQHILNFNQQQSNSQQQQHNVQQKPQQTAQQHLYQKVINDHSKNPSTSSNSPNVQKQQQFNIPQQQTVQQLLEQQMLQQQTIMQQQQLQHLSQQNNHQRKGHKISEAHLNKSIPINVSF